MNNKKNHLRQRLNKQEDAANLGDPFAIMSSMPEEGMIEQSKFCR